MNTNCRHKFQQNYSASSTQSNVSWTCSEAKELPSTCIILVMGYMIKIPKCSIMHLLKKSGLWWMSFIHRQETKLHGL
jgi:hypothetical protein